MSKFVHKLYIVPIDRSCLTVIAVRLIDNMCNIGSGVCVCLCMSYWDCTVGQDGYGWTVYAGIGVRWVWCVCVCVSKILFYDNLFLFCSIVVCLLNMITSYVSLLLEETFFFFFFKVKFEIIFREINSLAVE